MSSVRNILTRSEATDIARLKVKEYQPEAVEERPLAFSFAQTVKTDYDPFNGAADASLAGLLEPSMSLTSPSAPGTQELSVSRLRSTGISKEESAQAFLAGEDVWTEARSSSDQEKRQKTQRTRYRVSSAEVLFGHKQAPISTSSSCEPARGQKVRNNKNNKSKPIAKRQKKK